MKKLIYFPFCVVLISVSCQKEVSETLLKGNGTDSTASLLRKQVITYLADNTDYFIHEFQYDSSGQLSKRHNTVKIRDTNGNITVNEGLIIYHRDILGRITRIEYPPSSLYPNAINTMVEYQDRVSNKILKMYDDQDKLITLFDYDNDGRVLKISFFQHYPLPTDPIKMSSYHSHSYDNRGNLTEKTFFQDDDHNGTFEPAITFRFEYDDKTNPLYPVDDALFSENWSLVSPNNTMKQINITPNPPIPGDTINYSYDYDSKNRPTRCRQDSLNVMTYFYD
jgi:hypothetical protein